MTAIPILQMCGQEAQEREKEELHPNPMNSRLRFPDSFAVHGYQHKTTLLEELLGETDLSLLLR